MNIYLAVIAVIAMILIDMVKVDTDTDERRA